MPRQHGGRGRCIFVAIDLSEFAQKQHGITTEFERDGELVSDMGRSVITGFHDTWIVWCAIQHGQKYCID